MPTTLSWYCLEPMVLELVNRWFTHRQRTWDTWDAAVRRTQLQEEIRLKIRSVLDIETSIRVRNDGSVVVTPLWEDAWLEKHRKGFRPEPSKLPHNYAYSINAEGKVTRHERTDFQSYP